MTKVLNFLKGKKTIIVGCLMALLGIFQGDKEMILEGLGLIFLRTGIQSLER